MEQQFGTFQYPLSIPDGNWSIVLDAPGGGVVGVILYNGEYAWDAPVKVKPYGTLVQWKACAFNESATELGMCREVSNSTPDSVLIRVISWLNFWPHSLLQQLDSVFKMHLAQFMERLSPPWLKFLTFSLT